MSLVRRTMGGFGGSAAGGFQSFGASFSAIAENMVPAADNTYDIGTDTSADWRNIYFQGKASCSGSGTSSGFQLKDVLSIYNDGSNQLQFLGINGRYFRTICDTSPAADVGVLTVQAVSTVSGAYLIDAKLGPANGGSSVWAVDNTGMMVLTATATAGTNAPTMINVPGTGAAGQTGWIKVEIGGTVRHIPYWT